MPSPWNSVFSDALKAGFGSGAKGCDDRKKEGFSTGRLKQCSDVPRTHYHIPAGGLMGKYERNQDEGKLRFVSWDFKNKKEATKICALANENALIRQAMSNYPLKKP